MVKRVSVPTFLESYTDYYDDEESSLDLVEISAPKIKVQKPLKKAVIAPPPPVTPPSRLQLGKVVSR